MSNITGRIYIRLHIYISICLALVGVVLAGCLLSSLGNWSFV
jgi:hypothetical protein